MRVLILEDSPERQQAMQTAIADRFPGLELEFFTAAAPMIARLDSAGLYDVGLVSLDHDLELLPEGSGELIDPGTGLDVADCLSQLPAVAPVVVHTTNDRCGDQMVERLKLSGWRVSRVVPYGGESWIPEVWRPLVRDLIISTAPDANFSTVGIQVIQAGLRHNRGDEWILANLLRAASAFAAHWLGSEGVSFELLYVGLGEQLECLGATDKPILSQFPGGTAFEVVEPSAAIAGAGPVRVTDEAIDKSLGRVLSDLGLATIQLEVLQPKPDQQAILAMTSSSDDATLDSRGVQGMIRELVSLLELSLQMAFAADAPREKSDSQSGLTKPPR